MNINRADINLENSVSSLSIVSIL